MKDAIAFDITIIMILMYCNDLISLVTFNPLITLNVLNALKVLYPPRNISSTNERITMNKSN